MSAAIPPSIESEVVDYEEEIKENDTGMSNGSGEYNAEDPVEDWLAEEGQTLKDLLTEWSERAGWRLIWNSNRNYTLTAGAMFRVNQSFCQSPAGADCHFLQRKPRLSC